MPSARNSQTGLWKRLWLALASGRKAWRYASDTVRGLYAHARGEHDAIEDGGRYVKSRARFWDELREGQREAAAHSGKLDR